MWIYLLGIIQEYLVIINVYNGNLIPFLSEYIEYSLVDLIFIVAFILRTKIYWKFDAIDLVGIISTGFAHIQWALHSPFEEWPEWWPAEKSANDVRHRTEYYDTHTMCFVVYLTLFIRFYDLNYRIKQLLL
tara:strand:- start:878 stop:1270 length:393 start_codon:yes stop_codon:yes gene_type:complete